MTRWELGARESIRDTIARYAHAADTGRFEDLARCFTEGGVLELADETVRGRAAIREYLEAQATSLATATGAQHVRHHVSSTWITFTSRDEAIARSYFLVVTHQGVDHWGRYKDTLAPDASTWRFTRRTAHTDGATPGGWAASH